MGKYQKQQQANYRKTSKRFKNRMQEMEQQIFQFYIKARNPRQFKLHSGPFYNQCPWKKTEIHYVYSIESFFKANRVDPAFIYKFQKKYPALNQEQKLLNLSEQLPFIDSVFMTTKGIGNADSETFPIFRLIKIIRIKNRNAKICIEVNDIQNGVKERFDRENFACEICTEKQPPYGLSSLLQGKLKETFSNNSNKTFIYTKRKMGEEEYINHEKIWFIKYRSSEQSTDVRMRIVITTSNLDELSWTMGTNMFWVGDYAVSQAIIPLNNLERTPNYEKLFNEEINLNHQFKNWLNTLFYQQINYIGIFYYLDIDLDKINFQKINFALISTIPGNLYDHPLQRIQFYTQRYWRNISQQEMQNMESPLINIISPEYAKCSQYLINSISYSFCRGLLKEDKKEIRIFYPNNKLLYDSFKEQLKYLGRKQLLRLFFVVQFLFKQSHIFKKNILKIGFDENNDDQMGDIQDVNLQAHEAPRNLMQESGNILHNQPNVQPTRTQVNNSREKRLYSYESFANKSHLQKKIDEQKEILTSLPHFKAISVFLRDKNGVVNPNKNIFFFGSQNMTPSAWRMNYRKSTSNIQLGLLFFDVPGLQKNILPVELGNDEYPMPLQKEDIGHYPSSLNLFSVYTKIQSDSSDFYHNRSIMMLKRYLDKKCNLQQKTLLDYPMVYQVENSCRILKDVCLQKYQSAYNIYEQRFQNNTSSDIQKKKFQLRNRNPDVLFCLQNSMTVFFTASLVITEMLEEKQGEQRKEYVTEVWNLAQGDQNQRYEKNKKTAWRYFQTKLGNKAKLLRFYNVTNVDQIEEHFQDGEYYLNWQDHIEEPIVEIVGQQDENSMIAVNEQA